MIERGEILIDDPEDLVDEDDEVADCDCVWICDRAGGLVCDGCGGDQCVCACGGVSGPCECGYCEDRELDDHGGRAVTAPLELRFVVDGKPVPYQRPGWNHVLKRRFTEPKSEKYQVAVRAEARAAAARELVDGHLVRRAPAWPDPEACALEAFRRKGSKRPSCSCDWCSRRYELQLLVVLPDRRTRDLDNILKAILDGSTRALWRDDRQVVRCAYEQALNPTRPRVEVLVRVCAGAQLELAAGGAS